MNKILSALNTIKNTIKKYYYSNKNTNFQRFPHAITTLNMEHEQDNMKGRLQTKSNVRLR